MTEPRLLLDAYAAGEYSRSVPEDFAPEAFRALRAVLDLHIPMPIYTECGHHHADDEAGTVDVDPVGPVCDDAYMYDVCIACCTYGGFQLEACATYHDNRHCWPCGTVRAITDALGNTAAN